MTTDPLIITHTVPLRGADATSVVAALTAAPGVRHIAADAEGRHVHITYDLRHLRGDDIEKAIDGAGARPATGPLTSLRRSWRRFTEGNILASVSRPYSSCCNKPPK